jgi:hypothetical protein
VIGGIRDRLRMPESFRAFLQREAEDSFSSLNSQVVQSIAERKARIEKAREHDQHAA